MSIRLRMTLWYSSILLITLIAFSVGFYALLERNEQREIDSSLSTRVDVLVQTSRVMLRANDVNRVSRQVGNLPVPGLPGLRDRVIGPRNPTLGAPDLYVQLVDAHGQVFARSDNLVNSDTTIPLPGPAVTRQTYSQVTIDGQDFRLLTGPVFIGATNEGTLQIARPLAETERILVRLRLILAIGIFAAVLIAAVTGWALAKAALRPIARVGRAAYEIGDTQDFSRRITYIGPPDEIGQLAETMNAMLSRLQAAYARVQTALEAQRRFVADASHELRTPLTTIRGNVEFLALSDEGEPSDRQEALHDIASEAERMSRLVSDLLTLARADAGQRIERQPLALRPLAEDVYRQARRMAGGVRLELGDVPDVDVSGSADHLKQLLFILLDNALKYTPAGGLVRLQGELVGGSVRVSVADTGPGIAGEQRQHIFDRFYRLDPSRHGEGAGLGLSIARWIVGEHGGRISVDSTPGLGSTFSVLLPLLPRPTRAAAGREAVRSGA